ncbi:hypothetical protein FLSI110296_06385 [Flavobacterium sinopsychrotolerans]|uniref:Uncharacterized protein n=1 Tax=Flavobacterium sinopsychrotolerans TaxID=604089 RepID=A0A1H8RSP7_9FLAO|nr:hypothetical protein SAMN04487942_0145 [Flavobacterium sinopsychrotolerans]
MQKIEMKGEFSKKQIFSRRNLIAKLKKWNSPYKAKVLFLLKTSYLKLNLEHYFYQTKIAA